MSRTKRHEFWTQRRRPFDSPWYREMITGLGCCVTDDECDGKIDPHHTPGKSEKPHSWSDLDCVGLCRKHHNEAERITDAAFQTRHGVDFDDLKVRYRDHAFILLRAGGPPTVVTKKKATTTRKNRLPMSKKFVPLKDRGDLNSPQSTYGSNH